MSNPWLKKNPFMSMWLSAANRVAGSLRGQATAQVKRSVNAAMADAADRSVKPLAQAASPPSAKRKAKRKR